MPRKAAVTAMRVALAVGLASLTLTACPATARGPDTRTQLAALMQRVEALEAQLAALQALISRDANDNVVIGTSNTRSIELRTRGEGGIIVDRERVMAKGRQITISARTVAIEGKTITIDGDSISLTAPVINASGSEPVRIKGNKIGGN